MRLYLRTGARLKTVWETLRRSQSSRAIIGIDLGTTNSAVGVVRDGKASILENNEGQRTTPSIVAFQKDKGDNVIVGNAAKRQALVNSKNTFFGTKRLIGRRFSDEEVQRDIRMVPYKIIAGENGEAWVETSYGTKYSPAQIGGFILDKMKQFAQQQLGSKVNQAVVTVPAYFNDSQRQATKQAGTLVGLEVVRVINEPTAAALAYGIDKKRKDGTVAVFDLGGGTFDISILDIEDGVFEVRATNGNTHLGGEDFDIVLLNYILDVFKKENNGLDLSHDTLAVQRIREAAERCKIELSHVKKAEINLPFIHEDKHLNITITEDQLDSMTMFLIEQTIEPVKKCIRDSELKVSDIDEVILVGGMTRMPKIRQVVEELFKKKPSTAVNPDEAVALGASIQGAVLAGQISDVVLLDVTPLSLGIETYGGIFSPLIPRNTSVPIKREQTFSTAVDGQTGVEISVYQGERSLVKDNKLIGQFKLSGIPPGPKSTPKIAVTFEIDVDGILNVTATDKTPYPEDHPCFGKPNAVSIQMAGETGLTQEDVDRLLAESEAKKQEDAALRSHFENASQADILCTDAENAVDQFGSLMDQSERDAINKIIALIREKISDIRERGILHDQQEIRNEVETLNQTCLEAIKNVAKKQQQAK